MVIFYYIARAILYIPTRIFFPCKVLNKGNFNKKTKSLIVISNHLSWVDILLLAIYLPKHRHFVGKSDFKKNIIVRLLAYSIGVIFIDRDSADLKTMRTCIGKLKDGKGLNLFPEGTRNKVNTDIQPIKGGTAMLALKGNATLLPINIHSKARLFKRNYINIGDEFTLSEYANKPINKPMLDNAANTMQQHLVAVKQQLQNTLSYTNKNIKSNKNEVISSAT